MERAARVEGGGKTDAGDAADCSNENGLRNGDVARSDGAEFLFGVEAVFFDVGEVVEDVGGGADKGEGEEGDDGLDDEVGVGELAGENDCGQYENVLGPLLDA